MALHRIIIGLFLVLTAVSCTHKRKAAEPPPPEAAPEAVMPSETPAATPTSNLPFAYEGEKGPEAWASLNPEWATCGKGKAQSPINLVWKKPGKSPKMDFSYNTATAQMDTAGFMSIKLTGANQLLLNGKVYALDRIEFHSPSEHHLSKTPLTMEIELIHKAVEGNKMAVVSVFAIEGKENPLFSEIWAQMANPSAPFQLDPARMIPPNKTFYRYTGSLTTPPCTEGVEWIVFNTPMELSKEQIEAYRSKFTPNSRPLQKQGGRKVTNY